MRRQFTLQLHDVPPGRAFTCPTCNAASFHPSNVLQVVCKACSASSGVVLQSLRNHFDVGQDS